MVMRRNCPDKPALRGSPIPQALARLYRSFLVSTNAMFLNCSTRFCDRQCYTRTNLNKDHVAKSQDMLQAYFHHEKHLVSGIPTVAECGDHVGMSGSYLSDLLKKRQEPTPQLQRHGGPNRLHARVRVPPAFQQGVQGQNGHEPRPIPQGELALSGGRPRTPSPHGRLRTCGRPPDSLAGPLPCPSRRPFSPNVGCRPSAAPGGHPRLARPR